MTNRKDLLRAINLATTSHLNQSRRDGTPYIYHPFKVAEIVKNAGYGLEYQITAILHDILEDTNTTEEYLREFFDEEIVNAVILCTKTDELSEEDYINNVLHNKIATVVKSADRIHNILDSVEFGDKKFQKKYLKNSEDFYEGRFCKAVDEAIACARESLYGEKKDYPMFIDKEKMVSYN